MKFINYNANPKGRRTGDCVIRAIAFALNNSWIDTYKALFENTLKTFYSISSKDNYKSYLKSIGCEMQKMPRKPDRKRYTVSEFCDEIAEPRKTYIISVANHLTCIRDKALVDTWNCGSKSVGNYWIVE